jgi:hypothetical protein
MTKHTDSSRSTDSGVSGNAQTGTREIRKIAEAAAKELFADKYFRDLALESNNHTDHEHAQDIAAAVIEKACSRLASRVEELEKLLFDAQYFAKYARQRMLDAGQNGDVAQADNWLKRVAKVKAGRVLAGAHAEEKE